MIDTSLRTRRRSIGLILLIALIVRLVFLFAAVVPHVESGVLHKPDSRTFDRMAWELATGEESHSDYYEPLILYYMAAVYGVVGHCPLAVGLANIGLSIITCLGVYYLTGRLFEGNAAAWAAIGFALYPEAVYWSVFPLKEALIAPLAVWAGLFGVFLIRERRPWAAIGLIAAAAGLYLARPPWLVLPVILVVAGSAIWSKGWRRVLVPGIVLAAGLGVWILVPEARRIVLRSMPVILMNPLSTEAVEAGDAVSRGLGGWLLWGVVGAIRLWKLVPEGYGRAAYGLIPFGVILYSAAAVGLLHGLRNLRRLHAMMYMVAPLLVMTALLAVTVASVRYRYPLLGFVFALAGTAPAVVRQLVSATPSKRSH